MKASTMGMHGGVKLAVLILSLLTLGGCQVQIDTHSLFFPGFCRSEVVGFIAGFGTTFAAVPDLLAMLKRRSIDGTNPTMAAIMAIFQILWVYYGFLIDSRPVIAWNATAILINLMFICAYVFFRRKTNGGL